MAAKKDDKLTKDTTAKAKSPAKKQVEEINLPNEEMKRLGKNGVVQVEESPKGEKPMLKKRDLPETSKSTDETGNKPVLKKRTAPDNSAKSVEELPEGEKPMLKKRGLPETNIEETNTEGEKPDLFSKKVDDTINDDKKETKEMSALDKMRERVSAQKKLDQNMMTKQSLKSQTQDPLRSKLSALNKELDDKEEVEVKRPKISSGDFDLKTEALETQNSKLKKDLDKAKQQLTALLTLEFAHMKVLDENSLALSNDFVNAVNNALEQARVNDDQKEQSLKDELDALQKEIVALKTKNTESRKASEEAQKAATQAQKAVNLAKKTLEEQESNEVRNFKGEISALETKLKQTEKELILIKQEKEKQEIETESILASIKEKAEKEAQVLKQIIKEKEEAIKVLEDKLSQNEVLLQDKVQAYNDLEQKQQATEQTLFKDKEEAIAVMQSSIDSKTQDYEALEQQLSLKEQFIKEQEAEIVLKNEQIITLSQKENNQNLEKQIEEQSTKLDQILLEYQKQLDDKDKEIIALQTEVLNFQEQDKSGLENDEISALENKIQDLERILQTEKDNSQTKIGALEFENEQLKNKVSSNTAKETSFDIIQLQSQSTHYQELLLSERNSHLQVEQKLCSDLNQYKEEIEKLQTQIVQMKSDADITRLNQQISTIEQFVNELKNNPQTSLNRDIYRTYYEDVVANYKKEQNEYIKEIQKRNKMLTTLRDEKLEIIKILKTSGKNPELIEKQVKDINAILVQKIEKSEIVETKAIEAEILSTVKEELVKYCDKLKANASIKLADLEKRYNEASNVSNLLTIYNNDCEEMAGTYSDELSKLNFELEINHDKSASEIIEEKVLFNEKQYKALVKERDEAFNQAMTKLTSITINKDINIKLDDTKTMNSEYFAFVGEEFVNSMNKLEQLKLDLEQQLSNESLKYEKTKKELQDEEKQCLSEIHQVKEQIVALNALENQTETSKQEKDSLMNSIEVQEIKLQNIRQYGLDELEKSHLENIKNIQDQYQHIIDEENKLKELYIKREQEALARLETEKAKMDHNDAVAFQQNINEYIYVEEETERVLESIQEKRTRIQEDKAVNQKPEEHIVVSNTDKQANIEAKKQAQKEAYIQKQIDDATLELHELENSLLDYQKQLGDLQSMYEKYAQSEKTLSNDFRDVRKYKDYAIKYRNCENQLAIVGKEVKNLDPIAERRLLKGKNAELKSLQNELAFYLKKMNNLKEDRHVNDYVKVVAEVPEIQKTISKYNEKIELLIEAIRLKKIEIDNLKKNNVFYG